MSCFGGNYFAINGWREIAIHENSQVFINAWDLFGIVRKSIGKSLLASLHLEGGPNQATTSRHSRGKSAKGGFFKVY